HVYSQIDLAGILAMVQSLAVLCGREDEGRRVLADLQARIEQSRDQAEHFRRKPRIFFEYMSDPLTTGIGWVSDVIEIAGGEDCFAELARNRYYQDRAVGDPAEVARRAPDIVFGNWAGRKTGRAQVVQRTG